jgi:D-alanyl-D-alanine carboxypeptidase
MRTTPRTAVLIGIFLITYFPAHADKVDDLIRSEMSKQHIPGLSLAVVRDGEVIKAKGYGLANVELDVLAKPETVYKIASVSKQFIASGIMLLAADGMLNVEDKICNYLEGAPDTWKDITIRHLLTHTSGIPREAPGFDPYKLKPDADVIKTCYPLPLRFTPGEKWEYCNAGYFILGEIIHKVSGKPWAEFLNERVFGPAEMSSTRSTSSTDLVANRAAGYDWTGGTWKNAEQYIAVRPSGAFLSTALDMAKWDAALYTDKVLKNSIRDQMWTPVLLNSGNTHPYGYGWSVDRVNGHKEIHHGGALPGFRSEFARFVDDKLTVVVLANCSSANADGIVKRVAEMFLTSRRR